MALLVPDMKSVTKIYGLCLLAVTFTYGTASASAQAESVFTRTITGGVVDKEDQPVADATVCAWGTGPMAGVLPCGQSSPKGQFAFDVHRPDTYTITASALAQGYPEAIWGFYGDLHSKFPVVIVDDSTSVIPVKVKLGPKAGRVIFTILDGDTNRPITKGSIIVCRIGDPHSCWSKSTGFPGGHYDLLTPDVPFTIKFETWEGDWVKRAAFDESGVSIEVLQVDLGARKEITVRLK